MGGRARAFRLLSALAAGLALVVALALTPFAVSLGLPVPGAGSAPATGHSTPHDGGCAGFDHCAPPPRPSAVQTHLAVLEPIPLGPNRSVDQQSTPSTLEVDAPGSLDPLPTEPPPRLAV